MTTSSLAAPAPRHRSVDVNGASARALVARDDVGYVVRFLSAMLGFVGLLGVVAYFL